MSRYGDIKPAVAMPGTIRITTDHTWGNRYTEAFYKAKIPHFFYIEHDRMELDIPEELFRKAKDIIAATRIKHTS